MTRGKFEMRKLAFICLMVLLLISVGGAAAQGDWSALYRSALRPEFQSDMAAYADSPHYTIDMTLSVTDNDATIDGHQAATYTNRTTISLDEFVFRLYPNLESYGAQMQVSNLSVDGKKADFALDETRTVLTVTLPAPLEPGASATVGLDYSIQLQADDLHLYGQFSYLEGVLALPNAYPVLSVYEPGNGWWENVSHPQGDAVYSETAFYTVSVTAPSDLILAASGSEVDLTDNGDGTLTHQYVAPLMRDFALMGSRDFVTASDTQDGVTITVYYNPKLDNAEQNAQFGLQTAKEAVQSFNKDFGAYPFKELDYVQTPTTAGGIEYPGLIVVAKSTWDENDEFFPFVIVHETAHQWWYSLVGDDQTTDPWMDESLAQFATAVYIHDTEGEDAYQAALDSFERLAKSYEGAVGEDEVIGLPVADYKEQAYFYIVYEKGPLFFAALADELGYDTMIDMLRDYFASYRYGLVKPEDMLNSFEASSGKNLDSIFEEWVGIMPVG